MVKRRPIGRSICRTARRWITPIRHRWIAEIRPQLHAELPGQWSGTSVAGDLDDGGRQRECNAQRSGAERFDGIRDRDGGDTAKHGGQHRIWDSAAGDGAGCGQQPGVGRDGDIHGAGQWSERTFQRRDDGDGRDQRQRYRDRAGIDGQRHDRSYAVTASAPGIPIPANFSLTNTAGAAASVTATAGTPQSTAINTAFGTALQATVRDAGSNPVSGVTVTFTAPGSGASARFSGLTTATAVTNASGIATAPTLTANGTTGTYAVTATAPGVATPASFNLTNTAVPLGSLTGSVTNSTAAASLTTEGPTDWIRLGRRKPESQSGRRRQISTYTVVGAGSAAAYGNDLRPLSWTDGTPTASSSNNTNGLYIAGIGNGFTFTAPADTTLRTLIVHVGDG